MIKKFAHKVELDAGGIERIFYLPVVHLNKTGSDRKYILWLQLSMVKILSLRHPEWEENGPGEPLFGGFALGNVHTALEQFFCSSRRH